MTKTLPVVERLREEYTAGYKREQSSHVFEVYERDRAGAADLIEALYGALKQYHELTDIDVKMSGPIVRGVRRHGHAGKTLQGAFEDACQAIKLAEYGDDG